MAKVLSFVLISFTLCVARLNAAQDKTFDLKFNALDSSELCNIQLNYFQENLDRDVLWARVMRDSWGSFPSGTFSGNHFDFGNFDQCVNFHHSDVGEIIGQHCTLMIPFDIHHTSDQMVKLMAPNRRFDN